MSWNVAKSTERPTLNSRGFKPVPYSEHERRILAALTHHASMLSGDLINVVYDGKDRPWNARKSVMGAVRSLRDKAKANREPFTVVTSEPSGPNQASVSLVFRKRKS